MINLYLEETGNTDKITFDQAASAESKLIINELTYHKKYNKIYKTWKDKIQILIMKMQQTMLLID